MLRVIVSVVGLVVYPLTTAYPSGFIMTGDPYGCEEGYECGEGYSCAEGFFGLW